MKTTPRHAMPAGTRGVPTTVVDKTDLPLYRQRTLGMLRRYFRLAVETGRLPSVLGREFFRARVTSYRLHTFEDAVIFIHDMEHCLDRLDETSRQVIARMVCRDIRRKRRRACCTARAGISYGFIRKQWTGSARFFSKCNCCLRGSRRAPMWPGRDPSRRAARTRSSVRRRPPPKTLNMCCWGRKARCGAQPRSVRRTTRQAVKGEKSEKSSHVHETNRNMFSPVMSHLPCANCYSEIESDRGRRAAARRRALSLMTRKRSTQSGMSAAKRDTGKTGAKPKSTGKGKKSLDARKVREELVNTVLKNGKPIMEAVVEEARKGNYLQAKYLFEFAQISEPLPEANSEAEAKARSLADILLRATHNQSGDANVPDAECSARRENSRNGKEKEIEQRVDEEETSNA